MEEKLNQEESQIRRSRIIGGIACVFSVILFAIYFLKGPGINYQKLLAYASIILLLVGILFILPITYYIFDIKDWVVNKSIRAVIKKLRMRAIIFNNLSILILIVTIFIIAFSFYQLRHPDYVLLDQHTAKVDISYFILVSQIGSVIILIFLVQILFRVFKYLIRVGGFYNGKADALELKLNNDGVSFDTDKLLESFTPQNYDISDVDSPNFYPNK